MILSETADDAEMVLWATVEGARVIGTAIAEADLTSALWSNVEECMGRKHFMLFFFVEVSFDNYCVIIKVLLIFQIFEDIARIES